MSAFSTSTARIAAEGPHGSPGNGEAGFTLVDYDPGVLEALEALGHSQSSMPIGLVTRDCDLADAGTLLKKGYVDRIIPTSFRRNPGGGGHANALAAHGKRLRALSQVLSPLEGHVLLLTGATGFVGGHFLRYLLRCSAARVVVVTRPTSTQPHDQRLVHLERLYPGRIQTLRGDIREPGLGISSSIRKRLSDEVNSVWHFAADTRFESLLEEVVFETNLAGTRNVIGFARELKGLERFHHVSTAFVAGNQPPGRAMPEAVLERPDSFKNPYEASKFEAERVVVESGLPFTIFRPSIVLGERVSGHCDGQTVYKVAELIRLATLVARRAPAGAPHRYRVVVDPDTTRNLVTVDDVVCAMLSLAARGNLAPFHNLTNPEPAPMTDVISVIAGLLNIPKYEAVRSLEGAPLSPFEAALQRVSGVFRPYMLNSDPEFIPGVSRAWIGPVGRTCLEYLLSSYFEQRYGRAVHAAPAEV